MALWRKVKDALGHALPTSVAKKTQETKKKTGEPETDLMRQLAFDFFFDGPGFVSANDSAERAPIVPAVPKEPPVLSQKPVDGLPGPSDGFTLTPAFSYHLERSRRRTVGFIVDERGLTVRAPRWVSVAEIDKMIQEREAWIQKKLTLFANWQKEVGTQSVRFVDGAKLPYLGEMISLQLDPAASGVWLDEKRVLHVNLPFEADEARMKDAVQVWFKKEAQRYLNERMQAIAKRASVTYAGWGLSSAKGRWGSCSSDRKIRLNWRLIHLRAALIDYVIAHELAHLDEMNHGEAFWRRVAEIEPGYEMLRKELKGVYMPKLPFESPNP